VPRGGSRIDLRGLIHRVRHLEASHALQARQGDSQGHDRHSLDGLRGLPLLGHPELLFRLELQHGHAYMMTCKCKQNAKRRP